MISYVASLAQRRIRVVNDNLDSFSFVDKTGPTVTTNIKSNVVKRAAWSMQASPKAYKWHVRSSDLSLNSLLPILYGVGLPFMQPKLIAILERLEKAPELCHGYLGLGHMCSFERQS